MEQNSLLSSCIRALHNTRGIDRMSFARCGISGPWLNIYEINGSLMKGILVLMICFGN